MPFPIVVYTKCDNRFELMTHQRTTTSNCDVFEMVEVTASYAGGKTALKKDFENSISKKECKQVAKASDFTLQFYLTKQGALSDINFTKGDLTPELKSIVTKGILLTNHWRPLERNGNKADEVVKLTKQNLLKQ